LVPLPRPCGDFAGVVREVQAAARSCRDHARANCHDAGDRGLLHVEEIAAYFDRLDDADPAAWAGLVLQAPNVHATAGRAGAWSRGASDANKDERRRLRDRIEAARRILADTVLRDLLLWLEAFRHDYEREKMRRGVLDFQDLLILARRLVQ